MDREEADRIRADAMQSIISMYNAIVDAPRLDIFLNVINFYKFLKMLGYDITKPIPISKIEHIHRVNTIYRHYLRRQSFIKQQENLRIVLDRHERMKLKNELEQLVKNMDRFPRRIRFWFNKSRFKSLMKRIEELERKLNDGYVGGWEINDNIGSWIIKDIQYMLNEPQHTVVDEDQSIFGQGEQVEEEKFKGSDQ